MSKHTPGPWRAVRNEVWVGKSRRICSGVTAGESLPLGQDFDRACANARLIAAAPELLAAQTMGAELNTPDFLEWIADRLVHVHGENPIVDYVLSLRARAKAGRAAITKATGAEE